MATDGTAAPGSAQQLLEHLADRMAGPGGGGKHLVDAGGVPARAVGVVPVQAGADAGEQRAGRLLAVTGLEVPRGGGVHVAEGQVLAAGNPVDVGEIVVPVGDGPAG